MKITEIRVAFGRTFIPPGGDKFQPARIDCGVTITVDESDNLVEVQEMAQKEVRTMMEQTYRAQCTRGSTPPS